jgi:hypothetical protein
MVKSYLQAIELANFKAFPHRDTILLEGKHLIAWGPNGSGKSSVFWALYTFLQCAGKPENEYRKYFDGGNQDLRNLYSTEDPLIGLSFAEKKPDGSPEPSTRVKYELTKDSDAGTRTPFIRSLYQSSEFISHRLLLNFSNFRNSQDLDLWAYFERDILPYSQSSTGRNLYDLLKEFKDKLNTETPKNLDKLKDEFNNGLQDLIYPLIAQEEGQVHNILTNFYNTHLGEGSEYAQLDIFNSALLDYVGKRGKRIPILPAITLRARHGKSVEELKDIPKPHIFFNEARINGIALAIRFVLMEYRMNSDTNNLLCLDDLLISLDMHNRMKVIDLLLNRYASHYQLLIFTHEKGFFDEFNRACKSFEKDWRAYIFRESPLNANPKTEIHQIKTYYDKAQKFFDSGEYEACGIFLRKEAERLLAQVFDPSLDFVWRSELKLTLGEYVTRARGESSQDISSLKRAILNTNITDEEIDRLFELRIAQLNINIPAESMLISSLHSIRTGIKNIRENSRTRDALREVLDKIDTASSRTLNPAAHFNDTALYRSEMEQTLEILRELKSKVPRRARV